MSNQHKFSIIFTQHILIIKRFFRTKNTNKTIFYTFYNEKNEIVFQFFTKQHEEMFNIKNVIRYMSLE